MSRVFYWIQERYDRALLFQAVLMIFVQVLLLHIALLHRPSSTFNKPFDGVQDEGILANRPYKFWQWRSMRPYWNFLGYYTLSLLVLQVVLGTSKPYVELQGYVALSIEALLPLPQIASNQRNQSCKGFRLSVLANWLIGDCLKLTFFFIADSDIPWAFKLCALFQAACDAFLGVQYYWYGEGEQVSYTPREEKEMRML